MGEEVVSCRVSIAVKRYHDHSNSYKGKHLIRNGLWFRGSICSCHGWKHGVAKVAGGFQI